MTSENTENIETSDKKTIQESELFRAFREKFESEKQVEEKLQLALNFMRDVLSKPDGVTLKDFWDAKKICGPMFKEQMNPIKRNHLWNEYAELRDEARRLKELKDEQTAFSVEQIELAIEALEKDIERYDALIKELPELSFSKDGFKDLEICLEKYNEIQQELHLIKTLIARLDGLRKEVLATDMRISHKNKILKRLSKVGDHIFPKRKELIKKLSDAFITDVESFVSQRFSEEKATDTPYFVIRDEIKNLQGLAKQLTLNTQAFNKTRQLLSQCWDKIKEKEKERREEMGAKTEEQKKNFQEFLSKIEAFEAFCKEPKNLLRTKILEEASRLLEEMRETSLGREHVKALKERIQNARNEALEKIQSKVDEKKATAKREIQILKEKLSDLIHKEAATSFEDMEKEEEELKNIYAGLSLTPMEIHVLERQFADLKSFILDKKENICAASALEELYEERAAHVEVIKAQVEEYRKELGGSNLDFEKAMTYRELYDSAKIHLEREMEALENLEEKLI